MNKLMGFYELKNSLLPSIPWEIYTPEIQLDENLLWTIRSAVNKGDDLNLPRLVGKTAEEAKEFADKLYKEIKDKGIVIYYPYFQALKSGTLNIFQDKIVIEAVKEDLWNLVTYNQLETSLTFDNEFNLTEIFKNQDFLSNDEICCLLKHVNKIKQMFRNDLLIGQSVLLEWSFASNNIVNSNKLEDWYLVFYEIRTI